MSRPLRTAAALLALVTLTFAPAAVAAEPRTTLGAVEAELMCDVCEVPLAIAESPRADQERREIRALIAQGKTKQQILDVFVEKYGPSVLAVPRDGGASITVWAVPAGAIALVLLGLLAMLPRWRRRTPAGDAAVPAAAVSDEDARRLDRDLASYDL